MHRKGCNEQVKFSNTEVSGFEAAIYGMRLPLQSHNRADSEYWVPNKWQDELEEVVGDNVVWDPYHLGENDKTLAKKLIAGGEPHRKFLRMIHCQVNITAPIFWWKQMDQYRIGVTTNSTSTMHKLADTPITLDCFEMDDYQEIEWDDSEGFMENYNSSFVWDTLIDALETLRKEYNKTKDKRYWNELIRLLPESWLQTRTVDLNYEVIRTIYYWRKSHKLSQWDCFCEWVESLPYADDFLTDSWDDQKE